MPTPNTQNNKYTPTPLPEVCSPRGELLSHIDHAASARLILVSAPAGSGKTVSTLLWLRASNRKSAWIGLDAYDNSTAVFYRMFCTGVLSAQPDNERMTKLLRSPDFDSSPIDHTINLLAEFLLDENEYALTLDDYHTVTNPEILKSLPYILRRLPHSFVTLILSRKDPDENFSDLIKNGQAAVIGPDALAFNENEIGAYFAAMGRNDASREAKAAFSFTGGWAMGVNALGMSAAPMPEGSGGHILASYINQHIWDEWDESLKAFMLASAVVDEMPVTLCETITGRSDAGELLEALRMRNIFVVRVEEGVYRYHHLFLDFLRSQPEYEREDNKKSWYAAARYYDEKEEHITARRYAYQSGDMKLILEVFDDFLRNRGHSFDEYLDYSREIFLSDTIEELCEKCPVFYTSCAWTAYLSGDARTFEGYMDKLLRKLPVALVKYSKFSELLFSMIALDYRTPFAKQIAQAKFLPPVKFSGEALRAASMSIQMPFLHRSCRDYCELVDTGLHAKLKKTFGKLLKTHYELILQDIGAGLALEQNRLNDALVMAQTAMSLLTAETVKEIRFAAYMHLAAVYCAMDKDEGFSALIEEAGQFIHSDAPFLRPNFLAFTARTKLWNGDAEAARKWLDNYFVNESGELQFHRLYQYFTTARAYLCLGEMEKAKDLAERLRRLGQDYHRPQDAAEAGALLSAVLWASGAKGEAQETMEAVLLEMKPHGFIRLIADEGAAVEPILKKISLKTSRADYSGKLDRVYVNNAYIAAYAVSKQRRGVTASLERKPVKLSKQQTMIVRLMAQGYKREDIIQQTGLSLSTVKTHINQLYGKLNVGTAADAVVRSRELGILD